MEGAAKTHFLNSPRVGPVAQAKFQSSRGVRSSDLICNFPISPISPRFDPVAQAKFQKSNGVRSFELIFNFPISPRFGPVAQAKFP